MNINEVPGASRPALPKRACHAWASSSDPVGLLHTPACQTKLIAPVPTSLPVAPSPRSPPWGGTQGVKSSTSPWLLGGAEETLIKVLTGKETHAHSALGRRRPTGETARSRLPRPASHTLGNAVAAAALARTILLAELGAAGPGGRRRRVGGGGTRGREASPGCAPRGPEPQISHRSARHSRVRPGTGRAGVGPAQPGSRGLGATARVPPPPPPRVPGAAGWTLGGWRCRDPLVSSRAGQKLCKRSLANRKFLIDKVLPLPHAGLQNKTKTRRERPTLPAAACTPLPPRRTPLLGPGPGRGELAEPRAPSAGGGQQTGPAGSFGSGPRRGRPAATLRGPGRVAWGR